MTSSTKAAKRAFTLVEASALAVLMLLMAALVIPNFVRMKRGQELMDFKKRLPDMAAEARESAITGGQAVDLQWDGNARKIQVVSADTQNSSASNPLVPTQSSDPIVSVAAPTGVDASDYKSADKTNTAVVWYVRFYPDGTAAPAAIEFSIDSESYSLLIDASAHGRVVDGAIPDLNADRWQAGDYVHRTQ